MKQNKKTWPLRIVVESSLMWEANSSFTSRGRHYREDYLECGHTEIYFSTRTAKKRRCLLCQQVVEKLGRDVYKDGPTI